MTRKWYSFSGGIKYPGAERGFFEVDAKPWKKLLEDNSALIREELRSIIENKEPNIIPYFNQTLASAPSDWTIFPLRIWNRNYTENCKKVPGTMAVLQKIPGVTSATFSILKANSSIKPHFGDTNVMYRCHLTLKTPGSLPEIGMRVNGIEISWQEGKLFAFCDACPHEVWNRTGEDRWVLIIDILREEFLKQEKIICREVNATLWWQWKFQKNYFIRHIPAWGRWLMMKVTSWFMN